MGSRGLAQSMGESLCLSLKSGIAILSPSLFRQNMDTKRTFLTLGAVALMMIATVGIFETIKPIAIAKKKAIEADLIEDLIKDTPIHSPIRQKRVIKGAEVTETDIELLQRTTVLAINRYSQCEDKLASIRIDLD